MPKSTVVITGGAGFLGSHLCDKFIAEDFKVICIDNLLTGNADNIAHLAGNENFKFIKHDITNYIFIAGTAFARWKETPKECPARATYYVHKEAWHEGNVGKISKVDDGYNLCRSRRMGYGQDNDAFFPT